jgi:hypothetical protein
MLALVALGHHIEGLAVACIAAEEPRFVVEGPSMEYTGVVNQNYPNHHDVACQSSLSSPDWIYPWRRLNWPLIFHYPPLLKPLLATVPHWHLFHIPVTFSSELPKMRSRANLYSSSRSSLVNLTEVSLGCLFCSS